MKKTCIDGKIDGSSLFSAEKVGSNEDLMREIFLRVPVRSLIRFKVVSKLWSSVISDAQFAQERTHRLNCNSVVPSSLIFYNYHATNKKYVSISLDDCAVQQSRVRVPSLKFVLGLRFRSIVRPLQSCNGLLLCELITNMSEYFVCNPTTKSYKMLPQPCLDPREVATGFTLVFDPSISTTFYKVVSFAPSKICIYSSETGIWSTSTPPSYKRCYDPIKWNFRYGFYWNSLVYCWNWGTSNYHFFEYDLKEDSFREANLPQNPHGYSEQTLRYFGQSQDRLHLVFVGTYYAKTFKVFERDRDTLNWSVKYRVHIDNLESNFPEICVKRNRTTSRYAFSVLSVLVGEKEEDLALVLYIPGKIVSYNPHDKTSKVLRELESEQFELQSEQTDICRYDYCRGFNFIESLAAV